MLTTLSARATIGILSGQPVYSARLNQYLELVCRGISTAARQNQCNLLFACGIDSSSAGYTFRSAWPVADAESNFVPVGPWNTDALLVVQPVASQKRMNYLQALCDSGFPVIFIGPRENGRAVMADNRQGIHAALKHLLEHGRRKIAFLAGFENDEADSADRLAAYTDSLRALGLPFNPNWVAYGEHNWYGGQRGTREMLERDPGFDAILCSNDESARGALEWLQSIGRRVPHDVALIGFDDQLEARGTYPALTSIHNPMFEIGIKALELALRSLRGRAAPQEHIRVPARLVVRQSCGCATQPATNFPKTTQRLQAAVTNETRYLEPDHVEALCAKLLAAWQTSSTQANPQPFLAAMSEILAEVEAHHDDAHAWQAALSNLGQPPISAEQSGWIHTARAAISESARRQHNRYIMQQWVENDVARITTRLLAARDEAQIAKILNEELPLAPGVPHINIQKAHIALLDSEDGSSTTLSRLLPIGGEPGLQFYASDFPPPELGYREPFSLALLPLVFQDSETLPGYVIMEMPGLSPYAAFIVQHLTVALNNARLYREATEGRRLAEEANRIKSRFLSMVSHELRTPLSVIVGLSEMTLRSSMSKKYRGDLERIYASARHLNGLISDVLDLASSEAGQLKFIPDLLDFQEVLKPVLMVAEHLAQSKGLEWRVRLPERPLPVRGDITRLRQVTLNLLNNAVKFTEQGFVALNVETDSQTLTVSVSDSGVGVPDEEREEIFDEFRQSERTAARGYGGVGLGLAICKRIVEMHGGEIGVSASSETTGGSTFYFRLPQAAEEPPGTSSPEASSVFILHETPGPNNALIAQYLEQEGYLVQECALQDNPEWLNQVAAVRPTTLILNTAPQAAQTWEIFRRIKEHPATRDLPVFIYTLGEEQNHGDLLELDHLNKPINTQALWKALQRQRLVDKNKRETRAILVVDDEPAIRELHCRLVKQSAPEYQVLSAENGLAALEILQQRPVALVLLDLMMPQMDGFTLLKLLREGRNLNRDVPVIVLTAQILTEAEMERLNHGVAKVLGKGMFTIPETLAHVGAALARSQKPGSEGQRLVRKAMAYIHTHYPESLTRKDLARYINVSEDHLTHCFQQEMGLSPMAYVTRYRIQQAKQMLERSSQNITAIAQAVGIVDSDYFSRVFRQETGLSPREYRRRRH